MAIRSLLVWNRGEIACRIHRTCARLGIETIAAVAPDDRGALHARTLDRVVEVASYLELGALAEAIAASGADAVHPGYGFLAERADAARVVLEAGATWVGPPPDVLARTGDKLAARALAAAAGVPVLAEGEADAAGFPLLVKAAGGGGGRGMRIVRSADQLPEALAARREAAAAFGDDRVYLERLLERPRHVEVLLADGARRRREPRRAGLSRPAPPPEAARGVALALAPPLRARLAAAACAIAQAAGYVGAGTAEFLVEDGRPWFLELNARIQVEHPVTEMVTGLDLVERQLAIAAGAPLGELPAPAGHAVEARLYAEDPLDLLPRPGRLVRPRASARTARIRIDAGVEAGDDVPVAYDPLIAKLVAHAPTRAEALARLGAALAATDVGGATTNLPFLRWLVAHPRVAAGEATTAFLAEEPPLSVRRGPTGAFAGAWRLAGLPPAAAALPVPQEPAAPLADDAADHVVATLPGILRALLVAPGAAVRAGDVVAVLEAMKMEHRLLAQRDGTVAATRAEAGAFVERGAVLVELAPLPSG